MQELYESVSSLFLLSFIWFFDDVTAWNWFNMLIESIIWMIIIAALMISKSFLKFMMFSFHCIAFHSTFHLKHVNRMCLINIWSLLHSYVVIIILSTCLSCRNWLKSIFLMCSLSIMHCETLHDSCAVTDVNVSSLMSDIENELRWISLFRLLFMFIWSIFVWASVLSSLQCADAQSAIKTNHMHY